MCYSSLLRLRRPQRGAWEAVQARLANIKSKYVRNPEDRVQGRAHGGTSRYVFSGLLFCDVCSSPMTVSGGAVGRRYYLCASSRHGRCAVEESVRVA